MVGAHCAKRGAFAGHVGSAGCLCCIGDLLDQLKFRRNEHTFREERCQCVETVIGRGLTDRIVIPSERLDRETSLPCHFKGPCANICISVPGGSVRVRRRRVGLCEVASVGHLEVEQGVLGPLLPSIEVQCNLSFVEFVPSGDSIRGDLVAEVIRDYRAIVLPPWRSEVWLIILVQHSFLDSNLGGGYLRGERRTSGGKSSVELCFCLD